MVILKDKIYNEIIEHLKKFRGLALDSEHEISIKYPYLNSDVIRSIIAKHQRNIIRSFFARFSSKPEIIVNEYHKRAFDDRAIIELATEFKVPPTSMARLILNDKYTKTEVKSMLKNPDVIPDPMLSANVYNCILNDSQDSIIVDMLRNCIGEEYEIILKKLARDANLVFYDENDLRRVGYDKTPDLLTIPFLYKNTTINWIESKAMFVDLETHMTYFKTQLSCYENRFGTGIVIYWFGFQESVLNSNTKSNIIILDHFPEKQFLTTLSEFRMNQ